MALDLHPDCKDQLRASLQEQLARVQVNNGTFLKRSTLVSLLFSEQILPQNGKQNARLQKLIGETPLLDFVSGVLAREIYETYDYVVDTDPIGLSQIPIYADLPALSERLVNEFDSLPWEYTISVLLPSAFGEVFCPNIGSWKLSESVQIRTGNEELAKEYPLTSGLKKRDQAIAGNTLWILLDPKPVTWDADQAYLQVKIEGFIGKFTETEPLIEAISTIRAFFGLAVALRLLKPNRSYQPNQQKLKAYIHRRNGDRWIVEETHELESTHSETIRDLTLHDLDGRLKDEKSRAAWMSQQLASISTVLQAGDRAKNIRLGAQWLLDSFCGNDQLLQFVQAAVVIEILLGDKAVSDQTGLGELLANRCAYLIADTHSQRIEVLKDFRSIYDVRSKIVHRGKSRLALGDNTLFNKLRWMCRRIIQEEVQLLEKDISENRH